MDPHDRHVAVDWSQVFQGVGFFLLGLAALVLVVWLMLATPKATPFDADGVRCYRAATELSCIKTAEPAR
jgi:hypothetical protein